MDESAWSDCSMAYVAQHIHDLLVTRAEKAAERILLLEYRISEMWVLSVLFELLFYSHSTGQMTLKQISQSSSISGFSYRPLKLNVRNMFHRVMTRNCLTVL
jgi:hypothetical protein